MLHEQHCIRYLTFFRYTILTTCVYREGLCLYVCIHENTYTYICFRFIQGASIHLFMCMCVLLYVFGNFKDKQFLVVFPSPALSLLLYFSRIANWLFLVHACDFASFCFCLYRKNKSMYTLPARQLMSIQCSHSPPLALSLNSSQPSRHRQTILLVCMYLCMCVHIYVRVSHFSALRSPPSPSPPLCARYTQNKKLIASFDNQLHLAHGCFAYESFRLLLQSAQ